MLGQSFAILINFDSLVEQIEQIKNKLIPSWPSFVAQFVSLIVLLLIVIFLAYKPVKKMLRKRQDYIQNQILDAETNKKEALINVEQSKELVLESKKEANRIILDANKKALESRNAMIKDTEDEIVMMKEKAKQDIEKSKQDALNDIHDEMVNVGLEISSQLLKRNVNDADNVRLAEDFIKELDK